MAFFMDLLLQILSRLPAKFLRRFRSVSTHPDNCERLPESMAGFIYTSTSTTTCNDDRLAHRFFDDVSACGHRPPPYFAIVPSTPPFAILPKDQHVVQLLDGCNGLLLCRCRYYFPDIRCYDHRYVVCNPATQQSAVLPIRSQPGEAGTVRLGFDAAVSPHFHVFAILLGKQRHVTGVEVYSSETNTWVHKDNNVSCQPMWLSVHRSATVFLNGSLHFCTISHDWACRVTAVDTEGETLTSFDRPKDLYDGFIQMSQGKLHYACFARDEHDEGDADIQLEVYVMDDYDSKEWTMRHSVKVSDILEGICIYNNMRCLGLVAIHPDCSNLLFFTVGWNSSLVCYNIGSRHAKLVTELGRVRLPYVPYVPMYSELQSLQM